MAHEVGCSHIFTEAVIHTWEGLANAGLGGWSLDRAGSQLLVPEEHLGATSDHEQVLAGALKVHISALRKHVEELLAHFDVVQGAWHRHAALVAHTNLGAV